MNGNIRAPKIGLAIFLLLIYITSLFNNFSYQNIQIFIISILSCIIFDILFLLIRKKPLFFPSAALITGLILSLVASPNLSWYELILISILAMASKNFLRIGSRHIFNPAAFGLIINSFLFKHTVSWWGVSWQQLSIYHFPFIIYFIILFSPALISQYRMRRFRITLSFLFTYVLLNKIFNFSFLIFNLLFDPTILFFSIVMLPEPMTTPNNHTRQLLFGTSVAILSILISFPISSFKPPTGGPASNFQTDPLLFSLLIGNLLFFKYK